MTDNNNLFDIFQFLRIPVTDNLETVQKALNDLPAREMSKLKKNPAFSSMRRFLFSKKETPEFLDYVHSIMQKQGINWQETPDERNQQEEDQTSKLQTAKQWQREKDKSNKNEEQKLQRLAEILNQNLNRKTSPAFSFLTLFGSSLRAKLSLYLLIISLAMSTSVLILVKFSTEPDDATFVTIASIFIIIQSVVWFIIFVIQFIPFKLVLSLFKKGQFTVGHFEDFENISFTDEFGTKRLSHAKFTDSDSSDKKIRPYLVVYDKLNPDKNFAMKASVISLDEDVIQFRAIIPHDQDIPFELEINYDQTNKTFIKQTSYIWKSVAVMAGVFLAVILFASIWAASDGGLTIDNYLFSQLFILLFLGIATTSAYCGNWYGDSLDDFGRRFILFCFINPILPLFFLTIILGVIVMLFMGLFS